MPSTLLIFTAQDLLIKALLMHFDDTETWHVQAARTEKELQKISECPDITILDADATEHLSDLVQTMRQRCRHTHFVVLVSDRNVPVAPLGQSWSILHQPVNIPTLVSQLEKIMEAEYTETNTDELAEWLDDPDRAAQHLTHLTLESAAQATLIARRNILWAYAGGLSHEAGEEVANIVSQAANWSGNSDLLRFVFLKSTHSEHMLYATRIAPDIILAMVFDVETSFSVVRTQAERLAQKFISASSESEPPRPPDVPASAPQPMPEAGPEPAPGPEMASRPFEDIGAILKDVPPPLPVAIEKEASTADAALAAMSRSRPSVETHPAIRRPEEPPSLDALLGETRESDLGLTRPASWRDESQLHDLEQTVPSQTNMDETQVSETPAAADPLKSLTQAAGHLMVEPVTPALYNLHYACLLIPRRAKDKLTGDLQSALREWMREIALAYGWRLEVLNIKPDYMQWIVSVPPATSPGSVMRIVRLETSKRIFNDFPRIKNHLAQDFWAPGYLIMGGDVPHPPHIVQAFIKNTRRHQDF